MPNDIGKRKAAQTATSLSGLPHIDVWVEELRAREQNFTTVGDIPDDESTASFHSEDFELPPEEFSDGMFTEMQSDKSQKRNAKLLLRASSQSSLMTLDRFSQSKWWMSVRC